MQICTLTQTDIHASIPPLVSKLSRKNNTVMWLYGKPCEAIFTDHSMVLIGSDGTIIGISIRLIEIESISCKIVENFDYCSALNKAIYAMCKQTFQNKEKCRQSYSIRRNAALFMNISGIMVMHRHLSARFVTFI